jgi:hypothetical protein
VQETGVVAIDASDPAEPKIVGQEGIVETQVDGHGWSTYYGGSYGGVGQQTAYLWHGDVLAFFEQKTVYYDRVANRSHTSMRLRVFDLRDPQNLSSKAILLGDDREYTGLIADGDQLLTTRADVPATSGAQAKVKLYAERIDISNPAAPKILGGVNVPGAVVYSDHASGRVLTSELHRTSVQRTTWEQCQARFGLFDFEWSDNGASIDSDHARGTCTGYRQSLQLVRLRSDGAVLEDTFDVPEDQQVLQFATGEGRVFATLGHPSFRGFGADCVGPCGSPATADPLTLVVLAGFANGELTHGLLTYRPNTATTWRGFWGTASLAADGDKVLLLGNTELAIVDASDSRKPKLERTLPLFGSPQTIELKGGVALISLGELGLQRIEL